MATAQFRHGAYSKLSAYQRMLAGDEPEVYELMTAALTLEDEIRWLRQRIVVAQKDGATIDALMLLNAQLVGALKAQQDLQPGGDASGPLELTVTVVDGGKSDG